MTGPHCTRPEGHDWLRVDGVAVSCPFCDARPAKDLALLDDVCSLLDELTHRERTAYGEALPETLAVIVEFRRWVDDYEEAYR